MSSSIQMIDSRIPQTVVLCIDSETPLDQSRTFIERIQAILPHLNWRTHFFIVCEGSPDDLAFTGKIIHSLARFLAENRFVTFYVHPVIHIEQPDSESAARWRQILSKMRPFQQKAYQQQSETRLLILPIIESAGDPTDGHWIQAAEFFRASLAKPSVLLRGPMALESAQRAAVQDIRFFIEPEVQSGSDGLICQLWMNSVFEDLQERVTEVTAGSDLLAPCHTHRVIDQRTDTVYACFHDWRIGRPLDTLENISRSGARITGDPRPDPCPRCISRSLCAMTDNLIANRSQADGRKVHFELALAFSGRRLHHEAIQHAARAHALASSDRDRAAASITKGLCHLDLQEFEESERALKEAARFADDPGLVSFHRGRVQFEWRDYIEALDRFQEALASGSTAVPEVDLLYYMAVSHVHLQEYPDARSYLDRWEKTGQRRATMLYYRGLCDIGEGKFESALSELQASGRAGPPPEDMANLLFYTGFCLKELSRHQEAIPVLEQAARRDANDIGIFNLLGFCFYKTARHAEAVDCFEQAIRLDPRSAIDYANLATNLKELGRTEEAITMYRKALSLDPNIGFARENLRKLT